MQVLLSGCAATRVAFATFPARGVTRLAFHACLFRVGEAPRAMRLADGVLPVAASRSILATLWLRVFMSAVAPRSSSAFTPAPTLQGLADEGGAEAIFRPPRRFARFAGVPVAIAAPRHQDPKPEQRYQDRPRVAMHTPLQVRPT